MKRSVGCKKAVLIYYMVLVLEPIGKKPVIKHILSLWEKIKTSLLRARVDRTKAFISDTIYSFIDFKHQKKTLRTHGTFRSF